MSANAQISGIINSYGRVTAQTGSVITFDNLSLAPAISLSDAFGVGKKVLLIQMKGATINTSNTSSFGEITSFNQAGNYEFTEVTALTGSGPAYSLTLQALSRSYDIGRAVQLVSVPQYDEVEVVGTLTAQAWNPALGTGGILVLEATGVLTISGNIDVSGLGFRGGQPNATNQASCNNNTTFVSPDLDTISGRNQRHAQKGEGIADYAQNGIVGQNFGRGAIANGGGGGNSHNGGGGGGSNLGHGGSGGVGWLGSGACSGLNSASGIGAYPLFYDILENRLFLGGGGGGGQQNNSNGSRGGHGGGILLIRASTLRTLAAAPVYSLLANGENAPDNTGNDGAGGGGAGGVIFLEVNNFELNTVLQARANGGLGGDANVSEQHGGGGGGGIGAILVRNAPLPGNADFTSTPGLNGKDCFTCTDTGLPGGNNGGVAVLSGWQAAGLTTTLPIRLISFEAQLNEADVLLSWATLTESNTDYYVIERTQDFLNFQTLGPVAAAGESATRQDYAYTDGEPAPGLTYYRLKAIDKDGTFSYSEWASVHVVGTLQIYPNPAREVLKIRMEGENISRKITLYGADGRIYFTQQAAQALDIPVEYLPRGLYILRLQANGFDQSVKVVLQ
ncbi:MAG: T9SS type A sorting domain-containing protein [Microscillaceae bacterium]|nr:T9SS type A sorting domain-containing protein [Microscillaceae bacterium]